MKATTAGEATTKTDTYEFFWSLASLDKTVRQKAARELTSHLYKLYHEYRENQKNVLLNLEEEARKNKRAGFIRVTEILEKYYGPDVVYSLIRLTRGLSSSRQAARHGFSLALTELLSCLESMSYKLIMPFIDEACPFLSNKEQENSDTLFGRVFGYTCIIQSGILWGDTSCEQDSCEVIDGLVTCSQRKSYIRETCYHLIISMLPKLNEQVYRISGLEYLIQKTFAHCKHGIRKPDDLNLALAIQDQFPDQTTTKMTKSKNTISKYWKSLVLHNNEKDKTCEKCKSNIWKTPNILSRDNITRIIEALEVKEDKNAQYQEGRLHSVWERILRIYFRENNANELSFEEFWKIVVDEGLFNNEATHKRRFWGFQLFEKSINVMPENQISLSTIQQYAIDHKSTTVTLILQLIGKNGSRIFDQLTNSKTVERMILYLDGDGALSFVKYLKRLFYFAENEEGLANSKGSEIDKLRTWTINQMYSVLKNHSIEHREDWVKFIFDHFLIHGFFVKKINNDNNYSKNNRKRKHSSSEKTLNKKKVKLEDGQHHYNIDNNDNDLDDNLIPEVSESIRELCRIRFFNALGELNTMKSFMAESTTNESMDNNNKKLIRKKLLGTTSTGQSWARYAVERVQNLQQSPKYNLAVSLSDEAKQAQRDAILVIEQIDAKSKNFTTEKTNNSNRNENNHDNAGSQYKAFELLYSHAFLMLYNEPKEATTFLQDLHECYKKVFKLTKKSTKEKITDDSESRPEPIEVIVDILLGFLGKPSAMLRRLAEQVFETFCDQMTETSLDLLLDVYDDVYSDDEQSKDQDEEMAEFDAKLVEIFKQKQLEKARKKDAKYQVIHFKNKVLDLLEIFIRKQPSNPLVFNLILPLLDVVLKTNSSSDQAANKANGLLILKEVHQLAKKAASNVILGVCDNVSGYLVKTLVRYYENNPSSKSSKNIRSSPRRYSGIVDIYRESLNDFMTRSKSRLNIEFFNELATRFPEISWLLINDLFEFTKHPEKVQNVFRLVQAYEMTSKFVKELIAKKSSDHDQILLDFIPKYEKSLLRTLDYILSSASVKDDAANDKDDKKDDENKCKSKPQRPKIKVEKLKELLKIIITIVKNIKKRVQTNSSIWKTESTDSLEQALVSIRDCSCYKSSRAVKDLVNQLLKSI
ncbi:4358_t:CDS:10 [Ambispora gerdemannii]|uniref:4358_t:CDS:1 n=1 Tax=Ambispora gerdemannii TaxID=144530 RepID=A0A9N8VQ05_9GLOM|nr:4358_t:CDS:10 [Ambispora gerdemannii]